MLLGQTKELGGGGGFPYNPVFTMHAVSTNATTTKEYTPTTVVLFLHYFPLTKTVCIMMKYGVLRKFGSVLVYPYTREQPLYFLCSGFIDYV